MPRSHPPTLLTCVARTLIDRRPFAAGERVLVATSGGPDSTALLDVLARLRRRGGLAGSLVLVAHGVDHGLRESAAAELDLAEALAARHDIPFGRTRVSVASGGNLQARARAARRAALLAAAKAAGATAIATAHHADDRAETVLLRLLRGGGARALAPLPLRDGAWTRPLLGVTRSDVEAHVSRHSLPVARDPSNDDPRFARTRVRREVLPLLQSLDPAIVEHLNALADELGRLSAQPGTLEAIEQRTPLEGLPAHLPRRTRLALARVVDADPARDFRNSHVLLPGGLVARYDRQHLSWGVERAVPSGTRGREHDSTHHST
jgi:tRNA(Ile)-lysidine synthase